MKCVRERERERDLEIEGYGIWRRSEGGDNFIISVEKRFLRHNRRVFSEYFEIVAPNQNDSIRSSPTTESNVPANICYARFSSRHSCIINCDRLKARRFVEATCAVLFLCGYVHMCICVYVCVCVYVIGTNIYVWVYLWVCQ